MKPIINNEISCLDHGFVRLLNIASATDRPDSGMDSFSARDTDPALVARTSFGKGMEARKDSIDLRLVEYLMAHDHNTPVEMTVCWFEMKLPIFLARQLMRHRTASFNEISGRYVTLPKEGYIPEVVGGKSTTGAKQGQENNLSNEMQDLFKQQLESTCRSSYTKYQSFLFAGVAPEHARLFLHLNHYTQFVMKLDLHNLMHMMSLRLDSHAQVEARVYAQAIYDLLVPHLPEAMKFFDTYRRKLDNKDKALLREVLRCVGNTEGEAELDHNRLVEIFKRLGVY